MKMLETTCCALIHHELVSQVVSERWKQETAIPNHVQSTEFGEIGVPLQLVHNYVGVEQKQEVVNVTTQPLHLEVQLVQGQLMINKRVTQTDVQSTEFGEIGVPLQLVQKHVEVEQKQEVANVTTQPLQLEVQLVQGQLMINKYVRPINVQPAKMQQMQKFAKKLSKQIQLSARQIFISERKNAVRAVSNLDGVLLVHGAVAVRSVVVVKRPGHELVSMKMLELTCCAVIHQVLDLVVLQVV